MDGRWRSDSGKGSSEEPYRGRVGRTRVEPVLLPAPDGSLLPVHVVVSVDVRSDPHLAERLFAGRLHDVGRGPSLAVPFVYHDPMARRFALVVPPALRHHVLSERAAVLQALAEDAEHPVPAYVAHVPVVLGVEHLSAWLRGEEGALFEPEPPLPEETTHGRGERVVAPETEAEVHERATAVGRTAPGLESPERLSDPGEPVDDAEVQVVAEGVEAVAEPTRPRAESPLDLPGALDDAEEVGELDGLEEVSGEVEVVEEIDEADLIEEADGAEEEVSRPRIAVGRPASDEEDATAVRSLEEMEREARASVLPDSVPPPPREWEQLGGPEMLVHEKDERLWLHVRLEEGREEAFAEAEQVDLLVQLAEVEGCPVVLLAAVDTGTERPYVRRAAVDPRSAEGEQVLQRLEASFEAHVAVHDRTGRYLRRLLVRAPREENVRWLRGRLEALRGAARVDVATATERALAVPPPVRSKGLPFEEEGPDSVEGAWTWLERLAEHVAPEALDRAVLGLSIPVERVRRAVARAFEAADRWGLPPPESVLAAAERLGVAPVDVARVGRWLEAFGRTDEEPAVAESTERRRETWQRLLELAALHDVPVPGEVHERAWRVLHEEASSFAGEVPLADVAAEQLPELSVQQLGVLLDHPRLRADAAIELCRRGDPELLPIVYRAVRRMPRADVARVVPHVLGFGEAAADVLIDGLGARKTFVRQASAVALGELRLRRSVTPLVHLLVSEPSEVWREVARVLGGLGSSAMRAVARAARDPRGQEERIALALAHLALGGEREAVERLAQDADPSLAALGRRGLRLVETARAQRDAIEGEGEEPRDPVLSFGRKLHRALREAE